MDPKPQPVLSTANAEEAEKTTAKAAKANNFFISKSPVGQFKTFSDNKIKI